MRELLNEIIDFIELHKITDFDINTSVKLNAGYITVIYWLDSIRCERKIFTTDKGLVGNILIRQFELTKNILKANK